MVGILLHPTPRYASKKASLSPERLQAITYLEEAIAADPDQYRLEIDGIRYEFSDDDFVSVAFHRTGRDDADLIAFSFLDEA
jgi:hypothetical protein